MKILHLSTDDLRGGASLAAYRLHRALIRRGLQSNMLVQRKSSSDQDVLGPPGIRGKIIGAVRWHMDSLPLVFRFNIHKMAFTPARLPERIRARIDRISPDIVQLHWVARGFLRIESLRQFRQPLIWTLHDMWPFTGGCHYDENCGRYVEQCGRCPILDSDDPEDISRRIWRRKHDAWSTIDLTLVTPSRWLSSCAHASSLFSSRRIEVIPNAIDISQFRPLDKASVRARFGLPADKRIILFGAVDATAEPRKGFELLKQALHVLYAAHGSDNYLPVVFGAEAPVNSADPGLNCRYLGKLQEDQMAQVYGAADVFVAPSLQENLPNTVLEALACGIPCVAFDIGGMPDLIEAGKNGYLAKPCDAEDLARGIQWVVEEDSRHRVLAHRAREKVEQEFTLEIVGKRYAKLYEELIHNSPARKL